MKSVLGRIPISERLPGRFYGPCSGEDITVAIKLFGDLIDRFTFCDLTYSGSDVTAGHAVPNDWALISRVQGFDKAVREKATWYSGNRPFRPRATLETWRRPDHSDVLVELRSDLAQDVLLEHFAPNSISAFMHINDGEGEGGSDLCFLRSPSKADAPAYQKNKLLPGVVSRLGDGAVVLTDGFMADQDFRSDQAFELAGKRWELLSRIPNERQANRPLTAWRAYELSAMN